MRLPEDKENSETQNDVLSPPTATQQSQQSVAKDSQSSSVVSVANPLSKIGRLNPSYRTLCGPGPSNCHPRVLTAMALPLLGHLDVEFLKIMDDVRSLLQHVWQTTNPVTYAVSGTGSAAWETIVANLCVPGDVCLTVCNGYFALRNIDMFSRYGGTSVRINVPWGKVTTFEEIKSQMEIHKPQFLWLCHAETSTGARHPIFEGLGDLCRAHNCLFVLDTVTSIGGLPIKLDEWKVDAAYAGGQKCLSCPPGISPVTLGPRACEKMKDAIARRGKAKNWYLDLEMIASYLSFESSGAKRLYHHTAPISLMYAIREGLTLIAEEGLEAVQKRHQETADYTESLFTEMGIEYLVSKENRVPHVNSIIVPEGVDAAKAAEYCHRCFRLEVGAGLGELAGKILRIGLMGFNANRDVATMAVMAVREAFIAQGWTPKKEA